MSLHHLRSRVHEAAIIGTSIAIPSPMVVEALSRSSFDAILIDAEHSALSIEGLESLLRAADLGPKPAIVRLPEVGSYIARVLDLGAAGIVVPRIESAAQAQEVVERARYAPEGKRGAGPGRGQAYGAGMIEYVARANSEILVAIQIETKDGLAAADAILATPGIDAVVIGPFDLATSMGVSVGSPDHRQAIAEIFAAADRHGVAKGAFAFTNQEVADYLEQRASLLFVGMDIMSVVAGAETAWAEVAPMTGRRSEQKVAAK
jgi:2-keto-3-deoxy-L-rhamnonate aldolase RhmA